MNIYYWIFNSKCQHINVIVPECTIYFPHGNIGKTSWCPHLQPSRIILCASIIKVHLLTKTGDKNIKAEVICKYRCFCFYNLILNVLQPVLLPWFHEQCREDGSAVHKLNIISAVHCLY